MKAYQIIIDFITSFIITGGGAFGIALVVAKGVPLSTEVYVLVTLTGLVAAAKGTRALISLPPLSNGNYDSLRDILQKSKTGNTDMIKKSDTTPKP